MQIGKNVTDNLSTSKCSFLRGYNQLTYNQQIEFEVRMIKMFGYTSSLTFRKRLLGKWQHLHRELAMQAVENLFLEYGITDVWGIDAPTTIDGDQKQPTEKIIKR